MSDSCQPWLKFYPSAWLGDPALRVVSSAARGFWMDCLCLMHEARPRGHLVLQNGVPLGSDSLARIVGMSAEEVSALMAELTEAGVLTVTRGGIVTSRRMIRDDALAKKGRKAVERRWSQLVENKKKSGGPNRVPNRTPNTKSLEDRYIDSDTGVSESDSCPKIPPNAATSKPEPVPRPPPDPPPNPPERQKTAIEFEEWWRLAPRRVGRGTAEQAFRKARKTTSFEALIDGVRRWAEHAATLDPQFVPYPATWLNGKRWLDETPPPGQSRGDNSNASNKNTIDERRAVAQQKHDANIAFINNLIGKKPENMGTCTGFDGTTIEGSATDRTVSADASRA